MPEQLARPVVTEPEEQAFQTIPRTEVANIGQVALLEAALTLDGSFSDTYCRFRTLSLRNQVLLYLQGVREPTHNWAGWKAMDRHVRRGAVAKAIVRPFFKKEVELGTGEEVKRLKGFVPVNSEFAYSDTEGAEIPPVEPKVWDRAKVFETFGLVEAPYDNVDGAMQGWSDGKRVAVSPAAKYPFKTLVHEIAHCVLKHGQDGHDYHLHRGTSEFQAEGTAYLVLNELGLQEHMDMAESRAYIRTWLRGERPTDDDIRPVFTATDKILRSGWVEPVAEEVA